MKLKKVLTYVLLGSSCLTLVTACSNSKEETKVNDEKKEETVGKCNIKDCIKEIKSSNTTVEEINEIIGFEGEKSEFSDKVTWKLNSKNSITWDNSSTNPIIQANIDKKDVMSEDVDFSAYNDIKSLLDNGKSLTYEEMVEKLGGVEGTLAGLTSTSKRYIWVDKSERTFSATFSDNNKGKCSIISLR